MLRRSSAALFGGESSASGPVAAGLGRCGWVVEPPLPVCPPIGTLPCSSGEPCLRRPGNRSIPAPGLIPGFAEAREIIWLAFGGVCHACLDTVGRGGGDFRLPVARQRRTGARSRTPSIWKWVDCAGHRFRRAQPGQWAPGIAGDCRIWEANGSAVAGIPVAAAAAAAASYLAIQPARVHCQIPCGIYDDNAGSTRRMGIWRPSGNRCR